MDSVGAGRFNSGDQNEFGASAAPGWLKTIALLVVGLIVGPLCTTLFFGVFRSAPTLLPFMLVLFAGALCLFRKKARAMGLGLIVGASIHAIFLFYLFSVLERGAAKFGS